MSESKASMLNRMDWLAAECDRLEGDVVFLLQALMNIAEDHPDIELPDIGNDRFPERVWRKIAC